jgi:hypothetical protein
MRKYLIASRKTGICHTQEKEGRLTGLITSCVRISISNTLLRERRGMGRNKGKTRLKL